MNVEIEFMEAGQFFNEKSPFHPEQPLLNVIWEIDNKKFCAISSIESILWPNLCPEYATLPEIVRNQVEEKYGNELKKFVVEKK